MAATIPFFPDSLTWYIALSAAWTSSSDEAATSGSVATPTDAVRQRLKDIGAIGTVASAVVEEDEDDDGLF